MRPSSNRSQTIGRDYWGGAVEPGAVASVVMAERRERILKWVGEWICTMPSNEQTSQLVRIKEEIGIKPTRGLIKREKGEFRTDRLRDSIETGTDDGYHSARPASSLIGLTFLSAWRPRTPHGVPFSVTRSQRLSVPVAAVFLPCVVCGIHRVSFRRCVWFVMDPGESVALISDFN